jgi:hypothetical protein
LIVLGVLTTPASARADGNQPSIAGTSEVTAYADTNHVYVFTPTVAATVSNPLQGYSVGARYLVDVVSAASVDIVATASRRWEEVRHVVSLDGAYQFAGFGVTANANISDEPDYVSLGASAAVTRDFFEKNLTVLVGYNHRHDIIGRSDTPFSVFSHDLDINGLKGGATILLDRATILSIVGDVIFENGDPSKPYRYIPMFAPGTVVPRGASVDEVNALRLSYRPLEQLPLSRTRYAASAQIGHRLTSSTVRLSERVYTDSWGLKASTTDARVLFDPTARLELGPHVRFHGQTPVDFWERAYVVRPGVDIPALRTGERELGPLVSLTAGGELRVFVGPVGDERRMAVGVDADATQTQYLDDLYITSRTAVIGAVSFEVVF